MWAPGGVALILQSARPVQFAAGAFDDIVCANNLSVSRSADTSPYTGEAFGWCSVTLLTLGRLQGNAKGPLSRWERGPYWMGHYSPAGFTGAFLVTVRETVSSSTASAGSSLAMTT